MCGTGGSDSFEKGRIDLCDVAETRQLLPATSETLATAGDGAAASAACEVIRRSRWPRTARPANARAIWSSRPEAIRRGWRRRRDREGLTGVSCGIEPSRDGRSTLWGSPMVTDESSVAASRLPTATRSRAFFQGNRYLLDDLVASRGERGTARDVWSSLYAGVGLFATAIAARGDCGRDRRRRRRRGGRRSETECGAAADRGRSPRASAGGGLSRRRIGTRVPRCATALVDPPRTGMIERGARRNGLMCAGPPRIVYVSCDVATLARDTRHADRRTAMRCTSLEVFDMFPNTAHVETPRDT